VEDGLKDVEEDWVWTIILSVMFSNHLPFQLTSFVGREREIARVKRLLIGGDSSGARLVTLTDRDGTGKTRLAMEITEDLQGVFEKSQPPVFPGATWTMDAPFRETGTAISYSGSEGILGVEMEASALYAFAEAKGHPVICFAHITNQMGNVENDFKKGEAQGSLDAVEVISQAAKVWLSGAAS